MKISSYISEYLKADTLKLTGPQACTVRGVEEVSLEDKDTHVIEKKPAVILESGQKVLLNKTNARDLAELFQADDCDRWIGRTFELYFDPNVSFGGKRVGGLRVRASAAESAF